MMPNSAIVAACKLAFTGFEKNDRSELLRLFATEFVFDIPDSLPYGGTFYGKERISRILATVGCKRVGIFSL